MGIEANRSDEREPRTPKRAESFILQAGWPIGTLAEISDSEDISMTCKNCQSAATHLCAALALSLMLTLLSSAQITDLYRFTGFPNGSRPEGRVIADSAGNFYGTTSFGGQYNRGSIYELPTTGVEKILYSFTGGADGASPMGNLLIDNDGNLFGTTSGGGNLVCSTGFGCGTIFKLTPAGKLITLYTFTGQADGARPIAGLLRSVDGTFYGTTELGGSTDGLCGDDTANQGCGVVFKFKPNSYTVLHTFTGAPDGRWPLAPVTVDSNGNLYGTTLYGGSQAGQSFCSTTGCGAVFKIDPDGNETILHAFGTATDGAFPQNGQVTLDGNGNIYGVTANGGTGGFGVVYSLAPTGNESVLYNFTGQTDGGAPIGGLVRDGRGALYGTTAVGGRFGGAACGSRGCGVVFKITTAGNEVVLGRFGTSGNGNDPNTDLFLYKQMLYGTADHGGNGLGVVFTIKP